jgi:hypothetical protein
LQYNEVTIMYAVMLVLNDPEKLDALIDALWEGGIQGATIFESMGVMRQRARRYPIPVRYAFPVESGREEGNTTVLSIVPDEAAAQKYLQIAEGVLGNLDQPHTGVFCAWPIAFTKGISGQGGGEGWSG